MTERPDFSVIIPTYNGEPYVSEAVRSVLSQGHQSFELIVSDDGSTDGTLSTLESLLEDDDRSTILRHAENRGLAINTNTAVERARGEYLAFLDQDDVWEPDKLHEHLQAHETSNADVVYADNARISPDGTVFEEVSLPSPASNTPALIDQFCTQGNFLASMSFITIRRESWDRAGGFDPTLKVCADLDLLLRLARTASFRRIPEPLARRRYHDEMTSTAYREKYRDNERIRSKMQGWQEVTDGSLMRFRAIYTENRALGAFYDEQPVEAVKYSLRAFTIRPQLLSALILAVALADLVTGRFRLGQRLYSGYRRLSGNHS